MVDIIKAILNKKKYSKPKSLSSHKSMTYFVVRIGGWDGIAMETEIWLDIFLTLGYSINLVVGETETENGPMDVYPYNKVNIITVPELKLDHQKELYEMSFKEEYNQRKWIERFVEDKSRLKNKIRPYIKDSSFVFLHNFSIKHLIPTAWSSMYEMIKEFSNKKFIGIDADSPYERSYLMEKFAPDVLRILGRPKIWYRKSVNNIINRLNTRRTIEYRALPGPDLLPNLIHIVLNEYQRKICRNIYGIPDKLLYVIPDIGNFKQRYTKKRPSQSEMINFFNFLTENQQGEFTKERLNKSDYIYIISPVRPILRKKLLVVSYISKLFECYLKDKKEKKVVLVVTHPNKDEDGYFKKLKNYTDELELLFVHLGNDIKLRKYKNQKETYTYDEIMNYFSFSDSVCIVASQFGGWENGILESSQHKIPVCVNPLLPAFQDMNALGYNYISAPIMIFSDLLKSGFNVQYLNFPSIDTFFKQINERLYDSIPRNNNIDHNYKVGYKMQSKNAVMPIITKILRSHIKN